MAEIVAPGSETTDRIVKRGQYARAGISFYWRVELTATGVPVIYTYLLDSASGQYRDGEIFTGVVKATVPFPVEIDLPDFGCRSEPRGRMRGLDPLVTRV